MSTHDQSNRPHRQRSGTQTTRLIGAVGSFLLALLITSSIHPTECYGKGKLVRYTGVLQDENQSAIGGIYRIKFSLFKTQSTRRAQWSETHWVVVDNGRYDVVLGQNKKIPKRMDLDNAFIGVSLDGVGEIVREKLTVELEPPTMRGENEPLLTTPAPRGGTARKAKTESHVEYAEKAGFAFEAERATNADKINNLTVKELEAKLNKPPRIGSSVKHTGKAGGKGGYGFEYSCPKGYVVTGMKGSDGKFIDSLQLICSPLESR